MKQNTRWLQLAVLLILAGCSRKKENPYFHGEVQYSYTYTSNTLNADSLTAVRPPGSLMRYDANDYLSRFNGKDTVTCYYNGLTGKCASLSAGKYECEDYTRVTDTVVSYRLYDTNVLILNYPCRVLEIQKKHSWLRYYVSSGLKVAPNTYRLHRSYNWDEYGKYANGGLILRSEHRFKHFTMMGQATTILPRGDSFTALDPRFTQLKEVCK